MFLGRSSSAAGDRAARAEERPWTCWRPAGLRMLIDRRGQVGERGRFKKPPQRQLDAEVRSNPRDDLRRQQRMAAEFEKPIKGADALEVQYFGPNLGEPRFGRRPWGDIRRCQVWSDQIGRRQSRAVNFPLDKSGNSSRVTNWAGIMNSGNLSARKVLNSVGRRDGLAIRRHDVRNQASLTAVATSDRDAFANPRRLGQGRLDLAQFDAEPTNLHLVVQASEVLNQPSSR